MKRRLYGAIGAMLILSSTGVAMYMVNTVRDGFNNEVPFDRLIKNTTDYIKKHPADPMGPYTLARIHYLAFATRTKITGILKRNSPPVVHSRESDWLIFPGFRSEWKESELREHLREAVVHYRRAVDMDEKNGLFHLGLASVSEAALSATFKLGAIPGTATAPLDDANFALLWREQAINEYLKAYELSVEQDMARRKAAIKKDAKKAAIDGLLGLVSLEAGNHYVAMVNARGPSEAERRTIEKVRASLATIMEGHVFGGITPIVFRLSGTASLEDLLDKSTTVTFDLDGTGRSQRYTWLRPDTGILVWDPSNKGDIVSGHQLFGSVSFSMFWSDGYRALDALDDNRDGVLSGNELAGLAVWSDRNQNGVSEPGEVSPIDQTGIAGISARATTYVGASSANETGLTMKDGRVLPTYDWTTERLKDVPGLSRRTPRS